MECTFDKNEKSHRVNGNVNRMFGKFIKFVSIKHRFFMLSTTFCKTRSLLACSDTTLPNTANNLIFIAAKCPI